MSLTFVRLPLSRLLLLSRLEFRFLSLALFRSLIPLFEVAIAFVWLSLALVWLSVGLWWLLVLDPLVLICYPQTRFRLLLARLWLSPTLV